MIHRLKSPTEPTGIRGLLREAGAMALQARYLPRDWKEAHRGGDGPCVVLVHGLYASAGVFAPMRRLLHSELGASTHSFSYAPGPGIDELTDRLAVLLGRIDGRGPISLVGHSFGGLVARNYVLGAERDPRVVRTVSLATPFLGSRRSWIVPGQAGKDIEPEAAVLKHLRSSDAAGIGHLSVLAADDRMLVAGAMPTFGECVTLTGVGHNGILFDPRAQRLVADWLARTRR